MQWNIRWVVLVLISMMAFQLGCTHRQVAELSRGKRWVRSHPFTTMALTIAPNTFNADHHAQANLTNVMAWKTKSKLLEKVSAKGLNWHLHVYPHQDGLTGKLKATLQRLNANYSGQTGWLVWDEPNRPKMFIAAKTIEWLKQTYPDDLVYSCAFPMGATAEEYYGGPVPDGGYSYEDYLRDFATIMDTDIVLFNAYPFREGGGTSNLFPTLMTARKISKERNVPYWAFVQSHSDDRRGYRMPSESDVRMQVFMHLTCGYTGIAYFTYEDQQGPAMIEYPNGRRRAIYYNVARLNNEVVNLGAALRFLESTAVRYVPQGGNNVPDSITAWKPGDAGDTMIKAITIEGDEPVAWKDLLIGFFKDDDGRDYFMLTNLWHGMGGSSAERAVTVTLTLAPEVKVIGRLSRETGQPEAFAVEGGKFRITLPGGTGELLRFGDAKFPGLD
ncbi:MAG: hypothetical protein CMJ20_08470 [Phycisphaeraceae bacterium]|nr:hypothetical protein [Phycisphaeraceae bacterium]|tara:strand:- start:582 stop:1913 length:1332 start_codon:yes stop_codon:yes gene_type:complete